MSIVQPLGQGVSLSAEAARPPVRATGSWRPGPLWLALPGGLFLLVFLLFPSLKILLLSIMNSQGEFTFAAFARFFGPSVYQRVLLNTFAIAIQTTAICLVLGYPVAYWLSSLSKKAQQILSLFVLLSFWSSALVKNFSWLILLGRDGIVEQALRAIGIDVANLLFNRGVVVFAMSHTLLPLAVVTMLPVMNQIDRRLTMAASTLGADRAHVFWRIFFTQSMRGVAAGGLLVFISALGFFITPSLLGSPREMMLGQLIIMQINELQNWQLGSALAVVLVVTALLSCVIYDLIFGLSSLAGSEDRQSGYRHRLLRKIGLGIVNAVATLAAAPVSAYDRSLARILKPGLLPIYACLVIAVLLVPILAIVPMSFTSGQFLSFPPQGFSLKWYEAYLESPLWINATVRSFGIGFVVACATCFLGTLAALGMARSRSRAAGGVFLLFLLPMIVPSIVIAMALFYLAAQVSLVATNTGIALGHIVISMPMVFVILLTTFRGHDWALDNAAATLGANRFQVLMRITLPSIRNGLAAAFVIGFLTSFEELTIALFMGGGIKSTLPKQLWDDILLQVSPTLAAASTVVTAVVIVLFAALQLVRPRARAA
ncbi:ABC transporter permease subunit [Herbaspirillum sp. YR522]|uniref:ABC transporter permease subunit n=1 Tax=Herbaspirillum sp. YR522 TaxID=1144342 RepID=UPI00026FBC57|nr:ABC transporter permease subunit [Herbaspirillum sp. YR522]EJN02699.1 ABC-type spermidine/putrescine transport system, permease component I [Herbaspirillum sp. YR522]